MKPKRENGGSIIRIAVKVSAGAARNAIRGWLDQCLRVHLVTAPERGKANAALIALLAKELRLPKSAISIIRGEHSARKTLAVSGLSEADVIARLDPKSPGL
jgi:uncharacterized protein YggU (UPF0235/DUF167 family)